MFVFYVIAQEQLFAERLRASCELYAFGFGTEATAWLSVGAEVWPNGEPSGGRLPVKARCWVNRKYIRKNKAQAQAQLTQTGLNNAGTLYSELWVKSDTAGGETYYYVDLSGYIPADRIEPSSVIEQALSKLLKQEAGRLNKENMQDFLVYFGLTEADSSGPLFRMLEYRESGNARLRFIFLENDLIAIMPKREVIYSDFIAEVSHRGLKLIYLKKLKAEEERLLSEWLTEWLD